MGKANTNLPKQLRKEVKSHSLLSFQLQTILLVRVSFAAVVADALCREQETKLRGLAPLASSGAAAAAVVAMLA